MMERKLLEALQDVEERYIEEAMPVNMVAVTEEQESRGVVETEKRKQKAAYAWMKWTMVAACTCLVVYAGIRFLPAQSSGTGERLEINTEGKEDVISEGAGIEKEESQPSDAESIVEIVEKHSLLENLEVDVWGGGGGLLFYDLKELESWNPLNIEEVPDSLPVFRNLSFLDGSGVPVYLKEEELLDMAESAANGLGATIGNVTYERLKDCSKDYGEDERVVELVADTDVAIIEIEADGLGKITFKEPVEIPPEYQLVGNDSSCKLGKEALRYLTDRYADLLSMEDAVVYSNYDYNIYGDRHYTYHAYEQGDTVLESFLNYHFAGVSVSPVYNENAVNIIWFGDKRRSAEYMKDYPLMTPQEAKHLLLEGQYFNYSDPQESKQGLMGGVISEPELTYRVHNACRLYIPYYIFYGEIGQDDSQVESMGLKHYISYYVPAIQQEYWDELENLIKGD